MRLRLALLVSASVLHRVLDLTEQEGLQTACIPSACDGNMSSFLKICVHVSRGVVEHTDVSKDEGQAVMLVRRGRRPR